MKAQGLASLTETTETRHQSLDMKLKKSHNQDFNKMFADQYILAFRQYTRGIIAYKNFIKEVEQTKRNTGDNHPN